MTDPARRTASAQCALCRRDGQELDAPRADGRRFCTDYRSCASAWGRLPDVCVAHPYLCTRPSSASDGDSEPRYDPKPPPGTVCGAFGCYQDATVYAQRKHEWIPGWYCADHSAVQKDGDKHE